MGRTRTAVVAATASIMLTTGLVSLAAAPAQAACTTRKPTANGNLSNILREDAVLRTAPSGSACRYGTYSAGAGLIVRCFTVNAAGNGWYYVQMRSTFQTGWIYGERLRRATLPSPGC